MKFEEAIIELKKGKKIKRKEWSDGSYMWTKKSTYHPLLLDMLKEDWEVIIPPEVPKSFTRSQIVNAYADALKEEGLNYYYAGMTPRIQLKFFLNKLGFKDE